MGREGRGEVVGVISEWDTPALAVGDDSHLIVLLDVEQSVE